MTGEKDVNIQKLYGDGFFRKRHRYSWRAPIVCQSVVDVMRIEHGLEVKSACDVGAAVGDLVQGFLDLGVDAWGIEGSTAAEPYLECPRERMAFWDLREPLPPDGVEWVDGTTARVTRFPRVDVLTCFEVAEHLEDRYADTFLDTLVSLSDHIVMSACPPHPTKRPTKYHPNEQPREYWYEKLAARGYARDEAVEKFLTVSWYPYRGRYGIRAFWLNLLCASKEV